MAVISQLKSKMDLNDSQFGTALMLSIAYSASIGGMATLIGTPPNLIFAGIVQELYDIEITFFQWFSFGIPISFGLLFICWFYLSRFAFPLRGIVFPGGKEIINKQLDELGTMSREEKLVLFVFVMHRFIMDFQVIFFNSIDLSHR
jgi:sodium-dependent dicarboxylate transporter 2/3/5